jgi:hypothetical protein
MPTRLPAQPSRVSVIKGATATNRFQTGCARPKLQIFPWAGERKWPGRGYPGHRRSCRERHRAVPFLPPRDIAARFPIAERNGGRMPCQSFPSPMTSGRDVLSPPRRLPRRRGRTAKSPRWTAATLAHPQPRRFHPAWSFADPFIAARKSRTSGVRSPSRKAASSERRGEGARLITASPA